MPRWLHTPAMASLGLSILKLLVLCCHFHTGEWRDVRGAWGRRLQDRRFLESPGCLKTLYRNVAIPGPVHGCVQWGAGVVGTGASSMRHRQGALCNL